MSEFQNPKGMTPSELQLRGAAPAFPVDANMQSGMTLRQWYAGQALPALIQAHLANPENYFDPKGIAAASEESFNFADAMIAAEQVSS